jgi:hypothetical protein
MKVSLELFSGLKSVSQICETNGFITHTLDHNKKLLPSICCDILNFDYTLITGSVDFIWASPDCRYFSRLAKNDQWLKTIKKYRQYHYEPISDNTINAKALLLKTIEIIDFYHPVLWIIENPIGRLRHIEDLCRFAPYRYSINYKDWGFSYSKETDLYTNQLFCFSTKKIQRFNFPGLSSKTSQQRAIVPGQLVQFIISKAQW